MPQRLSWTTRRILAGTETNVGWWRSDLLRNDQELGESGNNSDEDSYEEAEGLAGGLEQDRRLHTLHLGICLDLVCQQFCSCVPTILPLVCQTNSLQWCFPLNRLHVKHIHRLTHTGLCRDEEDMSDEEDENEEGLDEEEEDGDIAERRGQQKLEDYFFRLGDMERFAEDAEQAAMRSGDEEEEEEDTGADVMTHPLPLVHSGCLS